MIFHDLVKTVSMTKSVLQCSKPLCGVVWSMYERFERIGCSGHIFTSQKNSCQNGSLGARIPPMAGDAHLGGVNKSV